MADQNINSMPAAGTLTGVESIPIANSGVTKGTTTNLIRLNGVVNFTAQALGAAKTEIGNVGPAGEPGTRFGAAGATVTYRDTVDGGVSVSILGTKRLTFKSVGTDNISLGLSNTPASAVGTLNVAVGNLALTTAASGSSNTAIGYQALKLLNGGSSNTAVGYSSGFSVTTGNNNTLIGHNSNVSSGAISSATAIGRSTLVGNFALALGKSTSATGNGSAAIGTDSAGTGASTSVVNEIKLGTALHTVNVPGRLQVAAGGSTPRPAVGGTIFNSTVTVDNAAASVETDLANFSIPANTLTTDGNKLSAIFFGVTSAVANNKRIRIYFDGQLVMDTGSIAAVSKSWQFDLDLIRESATVVRVFVRGMSTNPTPAGTENFSTYTRVTGLTLSNANALRITGTAAAAADISHRGSNVMWLPTGT